MQTVTRMKGRLMGTVGTSMRHAVWPTQGEAVDVKRENVYLNVATEHFLAHDDVLCVVASKGMGKTVLLKFKKRRLEREREGDGRLIIPRNRDLDFVTIADGISAELIGLLEGASPIKGRRQWALLWEAAITLSILHHKLHDRDDEAERRTVAELSALRPATPIMTVFSRERKGGAPLNPSQFLSRLLSLSYKSLNEFLQTRRDTLFQYYSQASRHGIYVFIDSFDQSLQETFPYDREIWINGQLGLLKAAWQIHRQNPHIKVYCSIRQEAYARYCGENNRAGRGNILVLRYDRREIERIFQTQLRFYDQAESVAQLCGLETVQNRRVARSEPIQSYIYRHTLGTPRSITIMGRELSLHRPTHEAEHDEREDRVRDIVNRVAGDEFVAYLQGEMAQFLDFLQDEAHRRAFFSRLPRNILSLRDLERIRDDVAGVFGVPAERIHPFCELYNLGLLGSLRVDAIGDGRIQYFKKAYEFDWTMANILPRMERLFFIHPAAQATIRALNPSYFTYREIVVGDGLPWTPAHEQSLRRQQVRLFVSYCSKDNGAVEGLEAELARAFDRRGEPHDIWRDRWRIRAGEPFQERIAEALEMVDYLLVVLSEQSLSSGWVNVEWRRVYAREIAERKVRVLPLTLGALQPSSLPDFLKGKQAMRMPLGKAKLAPFCDELARHIVELRDGEA